MLSDHRKDSQQLGEKDDGCMLVQLSHLVKVSKVLGDCVIVISISLNPLKLESGFFQENMMVRRCQTIDSIHLEWIGNILNNLYYITHNPQYGCACAN